MLQLNVSFKDTWIIQKQEWQICKFGMTSLYFFPLPWPWDVSSLFWRSSVNKQKIIYFNAFVLQGVHYLAINLSHSFEALDCLLQLLIICDISVSVFILLCVTEKPDPPKITNATIQSGDLYLAWDLPKCTEINSICFQYELRINDEVGSNNLNRSCMFVYIGLPVLQSNSPYACMCTSLAG